MQTLEYNKQTGKITLNTYTQDEFLESEIDITEQVTTLVLDKLYDAYDLEDGDELLITKNKSLETHAQMKQKKKAINEALNKKLKEQSLKTRTKRFNTVTYDLEALKNLCEKYHYNLVIDENDIAVYPLKEDFIKEDLPYIKHFLDSFSMDNPNEALKIAIDYVYKEIIDSKPISLTKRILL